MTSTHILLPKVNHKAQPNVDGTQKYNLTRKKEIIIKVM